MGDGVHACLQFTVRWNRSWVAGTRGWGGMEVLMLAQVWATRLFGVKFLSLLHV